MENFEKTFVRLNRWLVATTLGAVFLIVFLNVVGRYIFGVSMSWGEEFSRHLIIFGAFSGAGLALRQGRLVAIDVLVDSFPNQITAIIRWAGVVIMFVFMTTMFLLGVNFVEFGWAKETMSTNMSRGIPYLAIPIGCALFLGHLMFFAKRYVAKEFEHDDAENAETAGADA